jgi:hypothetical protein
VKNFAIQCSYLRTRYCLYRELVIPALLYHEVKLQSFSELSSHCHIIITKKQKVSFSVQTLWRFLRWENILLLIIFTQRNLWYVQILTNTTNYLRIKVGGKWNSGRAQKEVMVWLFLSHQNSYVELLTLKWWSRKVGTFEVDYFMQALPCGWHWCLYKCSPRELAKL